MDHLIRVETVKLSDGSPVFNVTIGPVSIAAVTEYDALDMADKIAQAINDHSIEIASVYHDFPDLTPPTSATSEAETVRLGDCAITAGLPPFGEVA